MKILKGISVAPGVVIGKTYFYRGDENPEIPRYSIDADQIATEIERFQKAVETSTSELRRLKGCVRDMNSEQNAIFEAHLLMAEDPDVHYQIKVALESQLQNIEWIVSCVARDLSQKLMASSDAYLRERAADVSDVYRRIVGSLMGINRFSMEDLSEDVILVARNLLPSDALSLNKSRVKALVMDMGSRTCHTAILARAFGIPAVMGLSTATREIIEGDRIVVDGEAGEIFIDPDEETIKKAEEESGAYKNAEDEFFALRDLPAQTGDGHRVTLNANIEIPEETEELARYGAEGIGLYRSEFLFLMPGQAAEEDVQYRAYSRVIKAMDGRPVTIRTVDIGGDKIIPSLQSQDETNPLLGWRAIRFSLSLPEMFKTQLRAILRASCDGSREYPVRLMFPMISGLEELERALEILEEAKGECRRRGQAYAEKIEVGAMIEVPAAAVGADLLAEKSDFFSIGTNDLLQYTLAADRGNEKVSYLAQPSHPAFLRLLKQTIDAAHRAGIKAAMCGELAGDPSFTPLLLGLGLDEFSMTAISIPHVKHVIRSVSLENCKKLSDSALLCKSAAQVNELVISWLSQNFPGLAAAGFK